MDKFNDKQLLLAGFVIAGYLVEEVFKQPGRTKLEEIIAAVKTKCLKHQDKILTHRIPEKIFNQLQELVVLTNNPITLKIIERAVVIPN